MGRDLAVIVARMESKMDHVVCKHFMYLRGNDVYTLAWQYDPTVCELRSPSM